MCFSDILASDIMVVLTILHFNDVYNVEGGAARMCTAFKSFSHLNPLVLFSGDLIAPSMSKYEHKFYFSYCERIFLQLLHRVCDPYPISCSFSAMYS